jgi:hypothetical protein
MTRTIAINNGSVAQYGSPFGNRNSRTDELRERHRTVVVARVPIGEPHCREWFALRRWEDDGGRLHGVGLS